jgi:hypothetical protein
VNDVDVAAQLRRTRIVCDNLANRIGALTAENLELLVRINELEHPAPALFDGNGHDVITTEKVKT